MPEHDGPAEAKGAAAHGCTCGAHAITRSCPVDCLRTVLTSQAFNPLARACDARSGPGTVGDVVSLCEQQRLTDIHGLGPRRIGEIRLSLASSGLIGADVRLHQTRPEPGTRGRQHPTARRPATTTAMTSSASGSPATENQWPDAARNRDTALAAAAQLLTQTVGTVTPATAPAELLACLAQYRAHLAALVAAHSPRHRPGGTTAGPAQPELTRRELHVLTALCVLHLTAPQALAAPACTGPIAEALGIPDAAVKEHLTRLYAKLSLPAGPDQRARLVSTALALGLTPAAPPAADARYPAPGPAADGASGPHPGAFPDHMKLAEVAAAFRVHTRTIIRWADKGKLPCFRTAGGHRRFRAAEVRALLAAACPAGQLPHQPQPASPARTTAQAQAAQPVDGPGNGPEPAVRYSRPDQAASSATAPRQSSGLTSPQVPAAGEQQGSAAPLLP